MRTLEIGFSEAFCFIILHDTTTILHFQMGATNIEVKHCRHKFKYPCKFNIPLLREIRTWKIHT
jgi:hypothetical protein